MQPNMARNDQPFNTINYNTDQFQDPIYGFTVHDDGSPTYVQPNTGFTYVKRRQFNGVSNDGIPSYNIILLGPVLVDDNGNPLFDDQGRPLGPL